MLWVLGFHTEILKDFFFKIFLSQTVRARVFIFGMKHLLVDRYQVSLDDAPRVKIGPTPGITI